MSLVVMITALMCCISRSTLGLETSQSFQIVTRRGSKLPGCLLRSVSAPSQVSCGHSCVSHSRCVSTNYELSTGLCELNRCRVDQNRMQETALRYHRGFVYNEYRQKDCQLNGCKNGGMCVFGEGRFYCSCDLRWTGESCDVKRDLVFSFTTLGAKGREGPKDATGYKGTLLETVQIDDGIQEWLVPITGQYQVEACGAAGGGSNGAIGGKGAKTIGEIRLLAGTSLRVLVGQQGQSDDTKAGSGGGGTFIVYANDTPLAIVGGGGGGGGGGKPGDPGQAGVNGSVNGGGAGSGGRVCSETLPPDGGSGGGFSGDGCCFDSPPCNCKPHQKAGEAFLNGGEGGECRGISVHEGGFGGGGVHDVSPGGGGGYSGGGATYDKGGGGGSFKLGESWVITSGDCRGNGYATFRYIEGDQ